MDREHNETAVITVCTNRPKYARIMLDHLDAQDMDFHIYVVLNSSNQKFCMGLVSYCAKMDKNVTLIKLWSMTTQIGLAYNCALWYAVTRGGVMRTVKIDDDVAIRPNGIRELQRLCDDLRRPEGAVSVLLPYSKDTGHYQFRHMDSNYVHGDRKHKFIYGACFMVPCEVFAEVGFFTEDAQRGMDLDYAVRVQDAGYKVVNHRALRALHLGTMNGTEVTPEGKRSRKYCTFGEVQVRTTIWDDAKVRQALIAQVYGAPDRSQVQARQIPVDSRPSA